MKKAIVLAAVCIGLATLGVGAAYAMGMRCTFCNGTGFELGTNFPCFHGKGTGHD